MKKVFFTALLALTALATQAQQASPTLMTVNGKAISKAAFAYAFHKNRDTTTLADEKAWREYLDLFINYKLKVAQAESLGLDSLQRFREELLESRNAQLLPALIDQTFVDSVAQALYHQQAQTLNGKPMLTLAHILVAVPQRASDAALRAAESKADSLYRAVVGGADFSTLARQYSDDTYSATNGGQLPTIYPGMTVSGFENQVYQLEEGQLSRPFLTEHGYHIVWLKERRMLDDYEKLRPAILATLRQQGIDELAAERGLGALMAKGQSFEAVMDSLYGKRLQETPDLAYLIEEYRDGLLLYEVYKQEVLDPSTQNVQGMAATFARNKKKYRWTAPRFKGYLLSAKSQAVAKAATKVLRKLPAHADGQAALDAAFNKDSMVVCCSAPLLLAEGENSSIDRLVFGKKKSTVLPVREGLPFTVAVGKKIKKAQSYEDVLGEVTDDYQEALNEAWIKRLRQQFPVVVNEEVFRSLLNDTL